ncbi:hypothetical protein T439DRAFT_247662 [Meredithblackwellia eburnea MCA 4105]
MACQGLLLGFAPPQLACSFLFLPFSWSSALGFPLMWHLNTVFPWFVYGIQVALGKKFKNHRVGLDPFEYRESRHFRATLDKCDAFGFHVSNSSYSACADQLRGPGTVQLVGPFFELPGATFALGSTASKFMKQIDPMVKFTTTQELAGYDRKWLYTIQRFTTKSSSGVVTEHCTLLSHIVLKIGRRTVSPARALALAGYGTEHGKSNWEIVKKMSKKEQREWLFDFGEGSSGKDWGIIVGPTEMRLETASEWPGSFVKTN